MSGCHLDETKSRALHLASHLRGWKCDCGGDKVPHRSTAGLMFPPADRSPMRNCSSVFFFCIFAFCLVELLPSRLVFSFVIPPHLSSEISFISFSILFFFSFFFILSARSVGVSEEAREQRSGERQRTRAALCHPFVFASQRPARRLDYHVSCFVKERGVALRGLSNTVPFFFFPPHCGQS